MIFEFNATAKLIMQIAILILIGFVTSKYVRKIITRIFNLNRPEEAIVTEAEQIKITLLKHTISVVQYLIWVIIILSIGALLQMTAFVQLLATLGVIVGYVARDFVNDFMMGIIVLTEQQFRVGDTITVTDKKGVVLEIGLRTTTIILETGEKFIISNRLLTSVTVHPIIMPTKKRGKRTVKKGASEKHVEK